MSHEQEPQPSRFTLRFDNGAEIRCTSETTSVFIFEDEPFADHLWVYRSVSPDEEPTGTYYFRAQVESFNSVLKYMIEQDFTVINAQKLSEQDRYAYELFLDQQQEKRNKVAKDLKQIMPPPAELWVSDRQQRIIDNHLAFELYLIQHNKLNEGEQL